VWEEKEMIKRRQFRIKDFLVIAWWDTNLKLTWENQVYGAEVHYEHTGKYKIVYANTKRQLVKEIRLQCAIFKDPRIIQVMNRFDGPSRTGLDFGKLIGEYIPSRLLEAELMKTDHLLKKFEGEKDV
jgi:hypothetical protein